MKKLKLFAFTLITFLCFGVISVNAETVTVNNLEGYLSKLTTTATRPEIVKLGADIDIRSLDSAGNQDAIIVNKDMVLDLNGFTITTEGATIKLWYYGDFTFTITDSSDANTGKIYSSASSSNTIIKPANINDCNSRLVLGNIKLESSDSLFDYMIYYLNPQNGTYNLVIDGTTFIKGNRIFERNNKENPKVNVNIESMTATSMMQINQFGSYKVSDIIDTTTKELVVNGSVIDPNTTISGYDISSGAVVRAKDGFDVSDVTFDTIQYGYSSVSAEPISITTVGSTTKQVKTVTVNKPSKFTVTGTDTPTIAAGSTDNTTFTIKPVDGLAVGTHTAIVTVKDMDDKTYTANVTFEVTKANISPAVSIANWSHGSTASTPSVTGNSGSGTVTYEYKVKDSADSTYTTTVPTEIGEYTIRATVGATTNYNSESATANFSITDDKFEVTAVTFDTKPYGYSSVGTKPISITTFGSTSRQVKTVTVSDTSKFTVAGSGTPTIAVGSTNNTTFTIKPVDGLAVGTHTATITVTDMDDKTFKATVTFEVTKADIEPVVSITGWSYSDTASTPSVTGNPGNGTITYEYKVKDPADSTYTTTVPTEVGEYTIRAKVSETSNYNGGVATKNFNITKKSYVGTLTYIKKILANTGANYSISGSGLELPEGFVNATIVSSSDQTNTNNIFASSSVSSGIFEFTSNSVAEGKTDTVKLKVSSKNYEDIDVLVTVETATKTAITIGGLTYTSRDYKNNTPIAPTGTLTHTGYTGTINVLYESTDGAGYSSVTAPTDAGEYKVTYSIPEDDSTYTGSKFYTFKINKATPEYTIPTKLTGIKDDILGTVTLPAGFWWVSDNTPITAGTNNYPASYNPDSKNYENVDINIPVYGKSKFDINTSVEGGNGTITSSCYGLIEGEDRVITFAPATGYMIDTVKVNDAPIIVTSNTYNIDSIDKNYNIVVSYKKIPFTITVNEVTGATITPNGIINVLYGDNKKLQLQQI